METFLLTEKGLLTAKRPTYPPGFRRRILELVRSGRSVKSLASEFQVARQSIVNWLKQDDLDSGRRDDGLTTEERKELTLLRPSVESAAAWFARETNAVPNKSSDS